MQNVTELIRRRHKNLQHLFSNALQPDVQNEEENATRNLSSSMNNAAGLRPLKSVVGSSHTTPTSNRVSFDDASDKDSVTAPPVEQSEHQRRTSFSNLAALTTQPSSRGNHVTTSVTDDLRNFRLESPLTV